MELLAESKQNVVLQQALSITYGREWELNEKGQCEFEPWLCQSIHQFFLDQIGEPLMQIHEHYLYKKAKFPPPKQHWEVVLPIDHSLTLIPTRSKRNYLK